MANDNRGRKPNNLNQNIDDEIFNLKDQIIFDGFGSIIVLVYEWTNIVQEHFFMHTRLPCCLVFKKSYVNVNYGTYISVRGRCSDCGSVFQGSIKQIPDNIGVRTGGSGCAWAPPDNVIGALKFKTYSIYIG
ncbi:unnamed protein product [Macrosiphum euphorbiae]|uniref:Uncharacterized protein n=1 Tax=Macrosiphum euphorbiae TaxID=13131 RepID=A0AAV0XZY6_9HEMI|nr:unnamed protein product [Macrosiphum euphorbiae]